MVKEDSEYQIRIHDQTVNHVTEILYLWSCRGDDDFNVTPFVPTTARIVLRVIWGVYFFRI